ncbi:ABC transporter permease [Bacillus kwashiorkori]|uniref:ABC transporter permease n=1 Tax=Bacillus kwashiorkori TaxID=1522318 RepID=UPI00078235E6|nr:hypothetical protein [Bacillus kwashiorkori]
MTKGMFKNSRLLFLSIVKREKIQSVFWLIGFTFFTVIVPVALNELYPTQQDRDAFAETMENPAMIAMAGKADLSNYTIGIMTAHQMLLFTAILVGIMSIFLVTRNTRGSEEDGRLELISSLPVGRLANLHATSLAVIAVNFILAIVISVSLSSLKIATVDFPGSLLYGTSLAATGIFFASIAALFAQITVTSRGANSYGIAVLLFSYLIRAIGDVSNETVSAISPLGWLTKTEVYGENNWWPVILLFLSATIVFLFASYLNVRRDHQSGLLKVKSGKRHASKFLRTPVGLVVRLQRTAIISWAIGMLILGASYGSVLGDLESFFEGSDILQQFLINNENYSLVEQFLPMLAFVLAIIAAIPPIQMMLRLLGEEKKNRMEHLLGRAVSRQRLFLTYFIAAIINAYIMLSLSAIGLWSLGALSIAGGWSFSTVYGATIIYFPAIVVLVAITSLLIGWLPKYSQLIWLIVIYTFIVVYLGGLLQLPDWVERLTPFGYVPELPIEEVNYWLQFLLVITACMITFISIIGYRKRDIQS